MAIASIGQAGQFHMNNFSEKSSIYQKHFLLSDYFCSLVKTFAIPGYTGGFYTCVDDVPEVPCYITRHARYMAAQLPTAATTFSVLFFHSHLRLPQSSLLLPLICSLRLCRSLRFSYCRYTHHFDCRLPLFSFHRSAGRASAALVASSHSSPSRASHHSSSCLSSLSPRTSAPHPLAPQHWDWGA